jgi:UDP-N-acetyl-D-mannosaminuronic acid transferase (WecB/TagA/CpsF family)
LPNSAILAAGAVMDYLVGVQPTPPRWMGRLGLEWLFRLAGNPRRFWRRYLIEPLTLLGLLGVEAAEPSGASRTVVEAGSEGHSAQPDQPTGAMKSK